MNVADPVTRAADAVRAQLGSRRPRVGVVLGSGLGGLVDRFEVPIQIPYASVPGFPMPTVAGHGGELVAGRLGGVEVLAQSGRFHLYEGHAADVVALPVRVFAALGVTTLIVTNAAGGLRWTFGPGTLMLIADHINLTFRNPLFGPVRSGEIRFPDMSDPYDPALRAAARRVALERRIPLAEGVYAGLLGPSYETPAEIRMFQRLGADAVGMSTVLEVVCARALGIRCVGVSTITNAGTGMTGEKLAHEEVIEVGRRVSEHLGALVEGVVAVAGG